MNIRGLLTLLSQVYTLVRPYGLHRLLMVAGVSFLQAISQVVSVAAIFPFLSLASDPDQFQSSRIGRWLVGSFPDLDNSQLLLIMGVALIIALFVANAFNLFGEIYRARFTWGFIHWLRMRMLNQMNARPYKWFLRQNSSIMIKKTTQDMIIFTNDILSPIIDGMSRLMIAVLLMGTIVLTDPVIALTVALVLGGIYLVVFLLLARFRRHISRSLKVHWRGVFQQTGQFLSGIKPVKVHGVDEAFLKRIEWHSSRQSELHSWMPIISNGPRYLIETVIAAVFIFIILNAIGSGQNPAALVPSLGVIAMAGYRLLPAVQMLYSQLSILQTSRFVLDEIHDEFHEAEENVSRGVPSKKVNLPFEHAIELRGVSFAYQSERPILKDINLIIRKGSSVAFIGETGTGKSTLVDLILGLHRPTEGNILVDGTALDDPARIRAWQDRIGYVPQDIFLADDTIAHNIAFGIDDANIDEARVRQVAAMAQIADFIETDLPQQYETEVGEHGVRLSGGQRQRIALARALYHEPDVLLLDEATSALDNETERRFMETIYSLVERYRYTVLIVAHRLTMLKSVDDVYMVKNGRLVGVQEGCLVDC